MSARIETDERRADAAQAREEQHARLMEGLAAAIREKGLAGTQVSDIVRHAHASRRTFYKHFEDKEACFVELMNTLSDAFLEEVDRSIDREAPIDTYLSLVTADPALAAAYASPEPGERTVMAQREGFERYAELIVSVVENDSARNPGVEPISIERGYMLVSGLHQTLVRALVRGEDLDRASYEFKAVIKLALSGSA